MKNEEEINAVLGAEELSSSPCPSVDSYILRMNLLDSPENDTQNNTSIESNDNETYADIINRYREWKSTKKDRSRVSDSENNPILEVEDNLHHERLPLTPVINNVLPPTGEINYDALPSLASLLSIPSSNTSPIASPSNKKKKRKCGNILQKMCLKTEQNVITAHCF